MAQYNFSTLNDKDLEILVRDLLSEELQIPFQSFKVGKDKGIDLRYSTTSSENKVVVQVKHYYKSGFNTLVRDLKNKEIEKVKKLNPIRYIFVTSIELSPTDKESIKKIFHPFISTTNDIYGLDDLNRLITKFEHIEKKHFKLWFSNVQIISKIVNNGIEGRSSFIEEKIKKNIGLYVINESYEKALDILRNQKILLITGTPGIGKTSLANIIAYNLLSHDFRLVYVDDEIKEAESVFENDPNIKQLFYFDDFLGSNYLNIIHSKNSNNTIVNFIDRIKSTKNKYLILTTRSTILNQARTYNENLSRVDLQPLKYELEVSNYTDLDKAKILYNHLYFSDLSNEMINEVFSNKNYWNIINHKNYNPRLIEYFTRYYNTNHLKPNEYMGFILENLENPQHIWEFAILNQLDLTEKHLLFTLLFFDKTISKSDLEFAYEAKIEYEVFKHGFIREINIFNKAFKNLLDGYITNTIVYFPSNNSLVNFVNPSLRDYLISFFNMNPSEKWRCIESFTYVEQFLNGFKRKNIAKNNIIIESNEIKKFLEIANTNKLYTVTLNNPTNVNISLSYLNYQYRDNGNADFIDRLVLRKLKEINWEQAKNDYFPLNYLISLLEEVEIDSDVYNYVKDNFKIILSVLIIKSYKEYHLLEIKELFSKFDYDFKAYTNNDLDRYWFDLIYEAIKNVYKNESENIINENISEIYSEDDLPDIQAKLDDYFFKLTDTYLFCREIDSGYDALDGLDLEDIISNNNKNLLEDDSFDKNYWKYAEESKFSIENTIDDLFSYIERY